MLDTGPRSNLGLRTAERYWILRFAGDELRFTHRSRAELWAVKLASQGVPSQLTWHEAIPSDTEEERRVA